MMAVHLLKSVAAGLRNQLRGKILVATTAARRFESNGSAEEQIEIANEASKGASANNFGRTTHKEDEPITDLNPTPVHWEPLDNLQPSPYIDYKGLILNQRAKALNPPPPNYFNVRKCPKVPLPSNLGGGGGEGD